MPFDGREFVGTATSQQLGQGVVVSTSAPLFRRIGRECKFAGLRWFALLMPGRAPSVSEPTPGDLLRMARALIEDENQWTRRFYETRDRRYCAVGALRAAARGLRCYRSFETAERMLHGLARQHGFRDMEQMNDSSTHGAVLALFDTAIAGG
ncbi:MAG: DUF6197 family protein [Acetobacteraceae bacterium]